MTPYKPNSPKGQRPKPPAMEAWPRNPNEATEPRVQRLFVGSHQETGVEPKGSAGAGLSVLRQHYKLMLVVMKKIFTLVLALAFFIPSVSSATALTSEQARSLIQVVQSSITTPASVFVPLITAFSSITITQAESLINVVQQSPATPASAFVDLLVSFTVDTPTLAPVSEPTPVSVPQPTTTLVPVTPPVSFARIEFVNRYLNRLPTDKTYSVLPSDCKLEEGVMNSFSCAYDSTNTVELRAVVYKDDGSVDRTALVSVTATDSTQNKQLNGTGNMVTFYTKDGQRHDEYGYVFNYGFTSAGPHTITFSAASGLSTSMTLIAI